MEWLDGISDSTDRNWSKLRDTVKDRRACWLQPKGSQGAGHDLVAEQQQQWEYEGIKKAGHRALWKNICDLQSLPQTWILRGNKVTIMSLGT